MSKTTEQFADAIALLMESYTKFTKSSLGFGNDEDEDEDEELEDDDDDSEGAISEELKAGLINSARDAIEMVMDSEDHSTRDIANVISALTEAIQDIDPDVYGTQEFEEIEDEDDEDEDDDDDLFEDDDFEDFDDEDED